MGLATSHVMTLEQRAEFPVLPAVVARDVVVSWRYALNNLEEYQRKVLEILKWGADCAQEAPMLYCGEQIGTGQEPMVSAHPFISGAN